MELNNIMPIRILFNNALRRNKEPCCSNDFYFGPKDQIIQVEGPNNRGKSEAWRTIHLANYLINAGYPIPADYARWSIYDRSHFISCKGNAGTGGSELGNSIKSITEKLKFVNPNNLVILDELGDSTNKYTAQELGDRILEPLRDINCKILITSHHDALTSRIAKEYGGMSLTPNPSAEGVEKFRLKPLKVGTRIDYKANEILDDMGFTKDFVKNTFSTGYKMQPGINMIEEDENDDLPF
jgi:dsDNA-specific endonuclease/ATPase MutS2